MMDLGHGAMEEGVNIIHLLLHQDGTRPHMEILAKQFFQKHFGHDCPCPVTCRQCKEIDEHTEDCPLAG